VGKLARRVDSSLVAGVAARLPGVSFVLVGPVLEPRPMRQLRRARNVYLLGERDYASMPAYVQAFDVCWIPHSVGEGETGGDPIKLYEYWAAGKDVIATPIDGLGAHGDSLTLVDNVDAAVAAITRSLRGDIAAGAPAIPADRTWRSIADRIVRPLIEPIASGYSIDDGQE
jgi:glycosyltransferase involved in cell wall biosynthesis